jgi:DNA-binding transcriptional LysR family regulator
VNPTGSRVASTPDAARVVEASLTCWPSTLPPMPVDVRQLRYFLAVAEELNFTRAARRLGVVQQALSTAIAQLEKRLGFKLFDRSTRAVVLTDAGKAWLPYARQALDSVDRAEDAARDLAAGRAGRLRLGLAATAALELTPRLLRAFADLHPSVELMTEHFDLEDPTGSLRDGRTDVALVRPPFSGDGIELVDLGSEARYAALTTADPLAARPGVEFAELEDHVWIEIVVSDPVWCDFWRVSDRRSRPVRLGARGRTLHDLLEAARAGRAIGLVPASIARSQAWPDVAFVEVTDIPPSSIAIGRRSGQQTALVRDITALARRLSTSGLEWGD